LAIAPSLDYFLEGLGAAVAKPPQLAHSRHRLCNALNIGGFCATGGRENFLDYFKCSKGLGPI
jgi:hypothetical protein